MLTGILFALITGLVFMLIGIVYSYAGTKINILNVLLLNNLSYAIIFFTVAIPGGFSADMCLPILIMMLAGVFNILAMLSLQKAMAIGKSGVAWAIAQSAFVGPYLGSLLFLGESPTISNVAGVMLILVGMTMLGIFSKKSIDSQHDSGQRKYHWLALAFLAFGLLVVTMYCVTASSYWNVKLSTPLRVASMTFGSVLLAVGVKTARRQYAIQFNRRTVTCVICLVFLGLASQSMIFVTVDALSKSGAAGIGYPVMNGTCIALYFLYSMLVIKEKNSIGGKLAVAVLVTGILLLCFA